MLHYIVAVDCLSDYTIVVNFSLAISNREYVLHRLFSQQLASVINRWIAFPNQQCTPENKAHATLVKENNSCNDERRKKSTRVSL